MDDLTYAEDGVVYTKEGEKLYKYFNFLGPDHIRVWQPVLEDVAALELRRWAMWEKRCKCFKDQWENYGVPLYDAGGACIVHDKGSKYMSWYKPHEGEEGKGIIHGTLEKSDDQCKPFNEDLGRAYRKSYDRALEVAKRAWKFSYVLEYAIKHIFSNQYYASKKAHMKLEINGRDYWYTAYNKTGMTKFSWPEDDHVLNIKVT